jgi:Holliday junction resolvase RusA-like endonuclease
VKALVGLAYRNDGQVWRLIVEKVYGPEPETTITIKPLTADAPSFSSSHGG